MKKVNYDKAADVYDYRYRRSYSPHGIARKLRDIAQNNDFKTILEVGCGTGHWLNAFSENRFVVGLDASSGMLRKAMSSTSLYSLVQGSCHQLPFRKESFDFIYCINAIHHFEKPYPFIRDCKLLLKETGFLVIVCMNPHSGSDDWFIYDYFEGTYENDLKRYPSPDQLRDCLYRAGFSDIRFEIGERLQNRFDGYDVFPVPQNYTSQLSLLTDQEYEKGIKKIKASIDAACLKNESIEFNVDISLSMVTAGVFR